MFHSFPDISLEVLSDLSSSLELQLPDFASSFTLVTLLLTLLLSDLTSQFRLLKSNFSSVLSLLKLSASFSRLSDIKSTFFVGQLDLLRPKGLFAVLGFLSSVVAILSINLLAVLSSFFVLTGRLQYSLKCTLPLSQD